MTLVYKSDAESLAALKTEKYGRPFTFVKTEKGYQIMDTKERTAKEIRDAASKSADLHAKGLDDAKEIYRGK